MINRGLVKTVEFKKPRYIGDPINTVRIFNLKAVDELCLIDIRKTVENKEPDFDFLKDIASEAFVPLSYGGGVSKIEHIQKLFRLGFEKVIINSAFINNFEFISEAVKIAGSQSIVAAIDVKSDNFGREYCYFHSLNKKVKISPIDLAKLYESHGVGEIIITSINHEGKLSGYNIKLAQKVAESLSIPVVINGGASSIKDLVLAINETNVHGVSASSMFVYYGKHKAILISYPTLTELDELICNNS
jgi:cyclase